MPKRSYRQFCAAARALDVVGDRWMLLIVRNLVLGPQTWTQLREGLPGVAKNLLSERLKLLTTDGVVDHDGERYGLTELGRELEPIVFALADWGERHFLGPPDEEDAFRLRYLMTSVRRKLVGEGKPATLQLWVNDDAFWVRLGPNSTVEQGAMNASTVTRCTMPGIRALLFTSTSVDELEETDLLTITGDRAVLERFRGSLRRG